MIPLKTSENQRFSDVFRGDQKGTLGTKGLNHGLQRQHQAPLSNQLLELAFQKIISLNQGFDSSNGYRCIWHVLSREGIQIPLIKVQQMLKEFDSEAKELKRRHRLKRQVYVNQCPDHAWRLDGYAKLKDTMKAYF